MKKRFFMLLLGFLTAYSSGFRADALTAPLFEASFLQGWYCAGWDAGRWETELRDMKAAGFRTVILQSSADFTYAYSESAGAKTDPAASSLQTASALYPTGLVSGSEQSAALENALRAAAECEMQVMIGTVSDSRWWNYGWGVPDEGFAEWSEQNAADNAAVIREIWEQFGGTYAAQIAGFYYNNEIWNMDAACAGRDSGQTAQIIGKNIRACLDVIGALCPEKPLLVSPFYNPELSGSQQFAAFLEQICREAQLRPQDIIALQDGGGRDLSPDALLEWCDAVQSALSPAVRFWINNETFGSDSSPKDMETLRLNYQATSAAEAHILFSWNHYYHENLSAEFDKPLHTMTGDVNGDGFCSVADAVTLTRWLMHDRIQLMNWKAADFDGSGSLNAADLSLLKMHLMEAQAGKSARSATILTLQGDFCSG